MPESAFLLHLREGGPFPQVLSLSKLCVRSQPMETLELVTEQSEYFYGSEKEHLNNLWINLIEERWRGPGNDRARSGKQWARGDRNAFSFLSPQSSPSPETFAFIHWQKPASTISHRMAFPEVVLCSFLRDLCWVVLVLFYSHSFWKFPHMYWELFPSRGDWFFTHKTFWWFWRHLFFWAHMLSFCHLSGGKTWHTGTRT